MKPSLRRIRQTVPTLNQALNRYLTEVSALKKGHTAEKSISKAWLATRLALRPVNRIRNTDLIEVRDAWLASKAPATVGRRLAFLSHVFTVIRKDWGLDWLANPVQLVRRPTVDDARDRRLFDGIRLRGVSEAECPREELEWILQSTRSTELPTIARLAAETGMRRSEICGIRRELVDLVHGVVRLLDTKNGTSRDVPLTPLAKELLRRFLVGRPLRGRVFTMRPGSVTRAFIRARLRAKRRYQGLCQLYGRRPNPAYFTDLRFHDLRHEATSRLADVFAMHELAKVSGHKDTRMLLRYYHPHGWELARKLAKSPLGRRQQELLRDDRMERLAA
ncbi:site-specific integrase [Bordetella bronchiseptica]|uniref:site-specific integrase n=1 Tax=Bordetella bronchiseptica TaxID=518 RepID=UPI000460E55A|nr:tyrosine-type recombinase/integrase [Bordetella bronchiseptica]KDC65717.1 site-specific recombinase, phage integrase family [Bordetella bronchiseptica MBORD591]